MPGLYVSEEISAANGAPHSGEGLGGFAFSVSGGKPRATISWMVTAVEFQSDMNVPDRGHVVATPGSDTSSEDEGWAQ